MLILWTVCPSISCSFPLWSVTPWNVVHKKSYSRGGSPFIPDADSFRYAVPYWKLWLYTSGSHSWLHFHRFCCIWSGWAWVLFKSWLGDSRILPVLKTTLLHLSGLFDSKDKRAELGDCLKCKVCMNLLKPHLLLYNPCPQLDALRRQNSHPGSWPWPLSWKAMQLHVCSLPTALSPSCDLIF